MDHIEKSLNYEYLSVKNIYLPSSFQFNKEFFSSSIRRKRINKKKRKNKLINCKCIQSHMIFFFFWLNLLKNNKS